MGPLEFGRMEEELGARLCGPCPFESCVLRGLVESAIDVCTDARSRAPGVL
jgi:hypothetical protein